MTLRIAHNWCYYQEVCIDELLYSSRAFLHKSLSDCKNDGVFMMEWDLLGSMFLIILWRMLVILQKILLQFNLYGKIEIYWLHQIIEKHCIVGVCSHVKLCLRSCHSTSSHARGWGGYLPACRGVFSNWGASSVRNRARGSVFYWGWGRQLASSSIFWFLRRVTTTRKCGSGRFRSTSRLFRRFLFWWSGHRMLFILTRRIRLSWSMLKLNKISCHIIQIRVHVWYH